MNKEEILQRSRNNKEDEGLVFGLNNGSRYGSVFFLTVIISLILLTFFTWRVTEGALLTTVLWAYLTGHFFGYRKAIRDKRKGLILVSFIATSVCFITYLNQAFFS